jgi:hypothetical protein
LYSYQTGMYDNILVQNKYDLTDGSFDNALLDCKMKYRTTSKSN